MTKYWSRRDAFGTCSLILGVIGVSWWQGWLPWWPGAFGTTAIVLAAIQWKRHTNRRSIAGFVLGIFDIVLAVACFLPAS